MAQWSTIFVSWTNVSVFCKGRETFLSFCVITANLTFRQYSCLHMAFKKIHWSLFENQLIRMTVCLQNFVFLSVNLNWWHWTKQELQLCKKTASLRCSFCNNWSFFYFTAEESLDKKMFALSHRKAVYFFHAQNQLSYVTCATLSPYPRCLG